MASPQVFRSPTLPLLKDLVSPFTVGTCLVVEGVAYDDPVKTGFMIDLLTDRDIALSLSMQFRPNNRNFMVITARKDGVYHDGFRRPCGIQLGQQFTVNVACKDQVFEVYANEEHLCEFEHRVNTTDITKLSIKGSLVCKEALITSSTAAFPTPPPIPKRPHESNILQSGAGLGSNNDAPPPYQEKPDHFAANIPPPVPTRSSNYEQLISAKMQSEASIDSQKFTYPPPQPESSHRTVSSAPYPMQDGFPQISRHYEALQGSRPVDYYPPSERPPSDSSSGFRGALPINENESAHQLFSKNSSSGIATGYPSETGYPGCYQQYCRRGTPSGGPCSCRNCVNHASAENKGYSGCQQSHGLSPFEKAVHKTVQKTFTATEKAFVNMGKSLNGKSAPYYLRLENQPFEYPQVLSITATPNVSMFSLKNRFEINLKHGSEYVLHINPRFDEKFTVLNSTLCNMWQSEMRLPFPFKNGRSFHMEIVAGDPIRIFVNGRELASFVLRTKSPITFIEIVNLCLDDVVLRRQ
ncbi:hypothetical protein QR680_014528 [Steinernema hermaphroditum]|uniref:Galectin n=1 Tax=Steinernema hermaphroditum TaxID=289476 RepID=A0AA39M472_9BILA|nr:hypothetical protein QR680_014528 [Steinernema hermaphroditum]